MHAFAAQQRAKPREATEAAPAVSIWETSDIALGDNPWWEDAWRAVGTVTNIAVATPVGLISGVTGYIWDEAASIIQAPAQLLSSLLLLVKGELVEALQSMAKEFQEAPMQGLLAFAKGYLGDTVKEAIDLAFSAGNSWAHWKARGVVLGGVVAAIGVAALTGGLSAGSRLLAALGKISDRALSLARTLQKHLDPRRGNIRANPNVKPAIVSLEFAGKRYSAAVGSRSILKRLLAFQDGSAFHFVYDRKSSRMGIVPSGEFRLREGGRGIGHGRYGGHSHAHAGIGFNSDIRSAVACTIEMREGMVTIVSWRSGGVNGGTANALSRQLMRQAMKKEFGYIPADNS